MPPDYWPGVAESRRTAANDVAVGRSPANELLSLDSNFL